MNSNYNQIGNKKLEKLATENTAFKNCQPDMSDVNFEIGKSSYTVKIFAAIAAFALVYGIRMLTRRYVGNPDMTFSIGDIIFWCFIGLIVILVAASAIRFWVKPCSIIEIVGQATRSPVLNARNGLNGSRCIRAARKSYLFRGKWITPSFLSLGSRSAG